MILQPLIKVHTCLHVWYRWLDHLELNRILTIEAVWDFKLHIQ